MDNLKYVLIGTCIGTVSIMSVLTFFGFIKMNIALSDFILLLLLVVTFVNIRNFQLKREFPYWWVFVLLGLWMVISNILAVYNPNINNGNWMSIFSEGFKIGISGLYFYIGYQSVKDNRHLGLVLKTWSIGCLLICVIGIVALVRFYQGNPLEFHTLVDGSRRSAVFVGTLTDPNLAALYLSVSFYFTLMWSRIPLKLYEKGIAIGTLILIPFCVLLTVSRGGMIGFGISLLFYMGFHIRRMNQKLFAILPLVGILFLGWLNIDATYLNGSLFQRFLGKMGQVTEQTGEFVVRKNLALSALHMGKDHFITGVGRGNYTLNSAEYLRVMGLDLAPYQINGEMKIPHNTMAGIIAELGVVGLILYLWVFLVLGKAIWEKRKEKDHRIFMCLVIPLWVGIIVQSLPLNIENFRGLWFLGGFLLAVERQESYKELEEIVVEEKWKKRWVLSGLGLCIVLVGLYVDTGRKVSVLESVNLTENNQFVLEMPEWKTGTTYTIYYRLKADSPEIAQKSAFVQVVSKAEDGTEKILGEYPYWKARGIGKVSFTPEKQTQQIFFRARGTGEVSTMAYIEDIGYIQDGVQKSLLIRYPFLPNSLNNWVRERGWLIGNESKIETSQQPQLWNSDLNIQLGEFIVLREANYERMENGQVKVTFSFECKKDMEIDYVMWFHGRPDNINLLSDERIQYGFGNFDHLITPETSAWEPGNRYAHEYIIPIDKGTWEFSFGLWRQIEDEIYRLYVDGDSNKPGLFLGEIVFDE